MRTQIRQLQAAAERTAHLIEFLDALQHASRCSVDRSGREALPRWVCDRLVDEVGYRTARIAFRDREDVGSGTSGPLSDPADRGETEIPIASAEDECGRLFVAPPPGLTVGRNELALLSLIGRSLARAFEDTVPQVRRDPRLGVLSAEAEVFRDCFEGVSVGMAFLLGHDGPLVANRAFADLLGYEVDELAAMPTIEAMRRISHPDDLDRELPLLHDLMNRRRSSYTIEKRFVTKDGTVVPGLLTTTFFFDGDGGFRFGVVSVQDISERVSTRRELDQAYGGAIEALIVALESRDPYTAGHQRRVAQLACAVADEVGLEGNRRMSLRVASMLHDIGKIAIPAEILTKPYGLSETEYSLIQSHPKVAYDILKEVRFPWPVADIVLQHHERLDGSGYPAGLTGSAILLEARILAAADAIEAVSSHRPYRPASSIEEAIRHVVENRSTRFDAQVVEACERVFAAGFSFEDVTPPTNGLYLAD